MRKLCVRPGLKSERVKRALSGFGIGDGMDIAVYTIMLMFYFREFLRQDVSALISFFSAEKCRTTLY